MLSHGLFNALYQCVKVEGYDGQIETGMEDSGNLDISGEGLLCARVSVSIVRVCPAGSTGYRHAPSSAAPERPWSIETQA